MKYILPYKKVAFQDCLWEVLWCDGERACIRSVGGEETRVKKVELLEEQRQ